MVLQGSVMGPELFIKFVLMTWMQESKTTDGTKLGRATNPLGTELESGRIWRNWRTGH